MSYLENVPTEKKPCFFTSLWCIHEVVDACSHDISTTKAPCRVKVSTDMLSLWRCVMRYSTQWVGTVNTYIFTLYHRWYSAFSGVQGNVVVSFFDIPFLTMFITSQVMDRCTWLRNQAQLELERCSSCETPKNGSFLQWRTSRATPHKRLLTGFIDCATFMVHRMTLDHDVLGAARRANEFYTSPQPKIRSAKTVSPVIQTTPK